MANFTGISHLDFSVSDVEASAQWYAEVLGLKRVAKSEREGRTMVVLIHPDTNLIIGLNEHHTADVRTFDERNSGLDHVGFAVPERADLDAWQKRLAEAGVKHSPVEDVEVGAALVFRDPDNIQLEFWWTKPR